MPCGFEGDSRPGIEYWVCDFHHFSCGPCGVTDYLYLTPAAVVVVVTVCDQDEVTPA